MDMIITFDGNKKVNAEYRGHVIKTDQSERAGGDGSAPEPFSLFLASIGTCAGIYAKSFCDQREIPTEGLRIVQSMEYDHQEGRISGIKLRIELPEEFPDKYKKALIASVNLCAVKRHLQNPPDIKVDLE